MLLLAAQAQRRRLTPSLEGTPGVERWSSRAQQVKKQQNKQNKKKKTEACFLLYLASTNRTSARLYLATAVVVAALPLHWLEAG